MLFKLSIKNIRKSFKDYAIYFFTLILGVAIFYVFNALESQTVMMNVTSSTREIIKLMTTILSAVSVFVAFILGFLIIYASRFLIKRRNKEFGIYLTLGMSKRKISMILFFETLAIGLLSLTVGLGIGTLCSQFMSIIVANMFEADLTKFTFVFSTAACMKTILYFGIMYLLVMIFNTVNISKCKLIDLLHASKKSETIKLKNPVYCTIVFILSSIVLGYAYYLVTGGVSKLQNFQEILKPIVLGVLSTFFIFWSLSGLIIQILKSRKKIYYKELNSFTVRQISSKVNTTVFSMTVICLMLFVTICVLSSALSIKNSMTANLKNLAPVDIEFTKKYNLTDEYVNSHYQYNQNMIEDSKVSLRESISRMDFSMNEYLTDIVELNTYRFGTTIRDTLGTYLEESQKKYPFLRYDMEETFIKLSDYNKASRLLGLDSLSLGENEYILVADYSGWIPIRNEGLKRNTPIVLGNKKYYPKYQKCQDGFIEISSNHVNMGLFVVPDDAIEGFPSEGFLLANYKEITKEGKKKVEDVVRRMNDHPYGEKTSLEAITKLFLYESSVGLGAMVTFIGLYLGIIFLISSAAILALKELSESSDNRERFLVLRKIGADERMVHKALFRQIAYFFLFPLLIAIIHSVFGIMFCNYILETLGNEKLLESILMTAIFLVLIYGGYFLITYLCSKNIIKEK